MGRRGGGACRFSLFFLAGLVLEVPFYPFLPFFQSLFRWGGRHLKRIYPFWHSYATPFPSPQVSRSSPLALVKVTDTLRRSRTAAVVAKTRKRVVEHRLLFLRC